MKRAETQAEGATIESPTVRKIVGPTILLRGGTYFDFLDPQGSEFTIQDVAHGLSMVCRFAGHCRTFYSVAQHCVHMSHQVPPEHALAALMHDAAEAFIGDVSRPLKDLLPQYRVLEKQIEAAVFQRFGVTLPLDPCIKEADIRMLATEQIQLMRNRDDWDYTRGRQPFSLEIPTWTPEDARREFLNRYAAIANAEPKA